MWLNRKIYLLTLGLASLMTSATFAASVQKCSAKTKSCDIKLEEGLVGDTVSVLNERAQPVATGWIIKRSGSEAVIKFKQVFRDVKRGYPVIVNIDNRGKKDRQVASRI